MEDRRAGIRLLNVREEGDATNKRTLATVYVPKTKRNHFLRKIREYGEGQTKPDSKGQTKPPNEKLVASIEDIREAMLRSFWTDESQPMPEEIPAWVELWIADDRHETIERVRQSLPDAGAEAHPRNALVFPDRSVLLVRANREQLLAVIDAIDVVAELRAAREPSAFFAELSNAEQAEWVDDLLQRCRPEHEESGVSVCILDSGVNQGHPLLQPVLAPEDVLTVDPNWGSHDHDGHGTRMAGLAAFGDLQACLQTNAQVCLKHRLESVKILPVPPAENPQDLWGSVTAEAIARAELQSPGRRRIVCMAVTATATRDRGNPTSWSAEIDQLAAGVDLDGPRRLILVSAGNVRDPQEWAGYPASNDTNQIHDPAQAWNAVTVGAYTNLSRIDHPDYQDYAPLAAVGELSPFSTTSVTWPSGKWPVKPDVVFEGGNAALAPEGVAWDLDDLQLLSTYHRTTVAHFVRFNATSAAVAQAAHFAASVQCEYPEAWPETIRALMVHSAEWTEGMLRKLPRRPSKSDYVSLLRRYGYGVPRLDRAIYCVRSRLTMVEQAELRPFLRKDGGSGYRTNELSFHALPWPAEVLAELGEAPVRMRVTLSYFIEPSPGQVGWKHRYRYASHGLRFELNAPGESDEEFMRRINRLAQTEEDGHPGTSSPSDHWMLGPQQRDVGSLHCDTWRGNAADLAASRFIAVRPTIGWWRERPQKERGESVARYSLVVSIESQAEDVDLYTPVATRIAQPIVIEP